MTLYDAMRTVDWCSLCANAAANGGKCPGDPAGRDGVDCAQYDHK